MSKMKLGIFFGGQSTEHEVSVLSTESVISHLNPEKYEILPVFVDKKGEFIIGEDAILSSFPTVGEKIHKARENGLDLCKEVPSVIGSDLKKYIDVAFPLIHGYLGEDGALQGLFRAFQIPFVGCDVLASAVCMDKITTKIVLHDAGLPVVPYCVLHSINDMTYEDCASRFGKILFVKTADVGSSVGISKVRNEQEYNTAIIDSFKYSDSVLVEQFYQGHEVECAVLGNHNNVKASCCGEIVLHSDFYSYDAKYINPNGAEVVVPANLPDDITENVRNTAVQAFNLLNCEGMARVDCFVKDNGDFVINEFNTIPGFTSISMYPKAWEKSGIKYSDLLDTVIQLGMERYTRDSHLERSYNSQLGM